MTRILPTAEAERNTRNNSEAVTRRAQVRLEPEVWPVVKPSFSITPGDTVFTIGSCFARNVEEHLARLGLHVPVADFSVPGHEWSGRPAGILNKYTPPSILQEISWTAGIFERDDTFTEDDCENFIHRIDDDSVIDIGLGGSAPVTYERLIDRRREIYAINRTLVDATCVVMTLGHIEAWYDPARSTYLQEAPLDAKKFGDLRERAELHVLDHADSLSAIAQSVRILRRLNPNVRLIITTSPVPLARTFREDDVITANTHSKSTLRSVAAEVAGSFDSVDYFPSFEIVTLTKSWSVWGANKTHVTDEFVGRVVQYMSANYVADANTAATLYQQAYTAYADGKIEEARRSVELALEEREWPDAIELCAQILNDLTQYELAMEYLRGPIEQGDESPGIQLQAGRSFAGIGRADEAQRFLRRARASAPNDLRIRRALCEQLMDSGPREARQLAKEGTELLPTNPRAHHLLIDVLERLEQREAALAGLEDAVNRCPSNPRLRIRLAEHLQGRDPVRASEHARAALEMRPNSDRAERVLRRTDAMSPADDHNANAEWKPSQGRAGYAGIIGKLIAPIRRLRRGQRGRPGD